MKSILSSIIRKDIRVDPFPHIVASRPMPDDDYQKLSAGFPPFSRIGWECPPERVPNNRRYAVQAHSIMDSQDYSLEWRKFASLHSSPEFFAEVAALFEGHWPQALLDALGGGLAGHSIGRMTSLVADGAQRIQQDARIEINTPVRDAPSSSRGPHLDTLNRIFTCLFYLRAPEDDAVGGDLVLYRWRNGPEKKLDSYSLPDDAVEIAAIIPYRPNQLVIFPQSINSLHGVGLRHPTPHMRRYVFITAELADNWLAAPER